MSLYKQLWIAVVLLLLVVFGVTFYINGVSGSRYLEQQLTLKNADDATSLALSLSQQKDLDPVLLEIQLAAQLDQSSYEFVEFKDPTGKIIFRQEKHVTDGKAPLWMQQLFPINAASGTASVTNGWNQLGDVTLRSHDSFAYDELWASAQRTGIAMVLAVFIAGIAGTLLLRVILNPLKKVVEQASAIGQRRFMTLPVPFTTEFAQLTESMNELSRRVKEMLSREAQRLERQREASELDSVTGVLTRDAYMRRLRARLESEGADATGSIAILRLGDLAELNRHYGHATVDTLLKELGSELKRLASLESEWAIGRLNGSDFCLLAPSEGHPKALASQFQNAVVDVFERHSIDNKIKLPTACYEYVSGDTIATVMTALDGALMAAEANEDNEIAIASRGEGPVTPARELAHKWRMELSAALENNRFLLETFPVIDDKSEIMHREGMVRLRVGNKIASAGEFMPWIQRLDMSGELDRAVVKLGMELVRKNGQPVHINLSNASLNDLSFAVWIESVLLDAPEVAPQFGLEVGEASAYGNPEGFRRLAQRLRPLGVQMGIEHVGYRLRGISKLGELGVDYIKVDSLFIREVDQNSGNEAVIRTYLGIANSLGVACIAEGVRTEAELKAVLALGVSGVTGPGVSEN